MINTRLPTLSQSLGIGHDFGLKLAHLRAQRPNVGLHPARIG